MDIIEGKGMLGDLVVEEWTPNQEVLGSNSIGQGCVFEQDTLTALSSGFKYPGSAGSILT